MKILVVTQYFFPESFRINDIVKQLVLRGHSVSVLTGLPNYPEGKVYPGYEESFRAVGNFCGATVYRCKIRPRKKGIFNLLLNYVSFALKAKRKMKTIKPEFDLVFFYGLSPISSGYPAVWYGKKYNIKVVAYVLDIWPESIRELPNGKIISIHNPIFLISKIISKCIYKKIDFIINKCDEFGEYLTTMFGISKNKMATIFEHAEKNYLQVDENPINNGIIDFMFLGNIGFSQNCSMIVEAFSRINCEKAVLHFVGDGSFLDSLKNQVNNSGLKNKVVFHGRCPLNETISLYNLADVCILSLSNKTMIGLTPPAKLPGYMAACRPVIASIDGAAERIIKEANCGWTCRADDVDSLSVLFQKAISNYSELKQLGVNGRRYFIDNFTIDRYIERIEQKLSEIIE